jgi:hypothetical protein
MGHPLASYRLLRRGVTIETRVDKFGQEDTTKSEAGVRTIPLGSGVVRALKEWRLRSAFSRDDELVFPKADGCFVEHTGFYKYALSRCAGG